MSPDPFKPVQLGNLSLRNAFIKAATNEGMCVNSEPTEEQRRTGAFLSSLYDADQNKGTAFIRSIESGNYLNDTFSGAASTMAAIMGREAAMSGEKVMWDNLRQSSQRLDPKLNLSQFDPA